MSDAGDVLQQLARRVVRACGLGRLAVVGVTADDLARRLRLLGADAVACGDDDRDDDGAAAARLAAAAPATVLVRLGAPRDAAAIDPLLQACRASGAGAVYVVVPAGEGRSGGRETWEQRAIAAGLRRHPCGYRVAVYERLDAPGPELELLFEPVPDDVLARYPVAHLERDRQLHMDMLREVGRRGDAHCVRYHKAAAFVRPGDVVLDLACGYGYGSWILFQESQAARVLGMDLDAAAIEYANASYACGERVRFEVGDAQALSQLADHSVDFVASFETIEHLPEPERYLDELRRVLRPAGRLMICAPNDWSDETGEDPNPHHLHVYTWERLCREVGARFLLEKGFVQTAGGAMKCHHADRGWAEVGLAPLEREAEWILLLGMATPIGAESVPYVETAYPIPVDDERFHVSAFGRDYDNPWLVRAIVTRGMRLENAALLRRLQDEVAAAADPASVDHGAALCGQIYAALGDGGVAAESRRALDARVADYVAIASPSPHQLRWQISQLFAIGELHLQAGDRELARARYAACAELDPTPYSPLLGNKTLDAHFRLAQMAVVDGDGATARARLLRCVDEARRLVGGSWRNVTGDPERPLPFGPAELAQLLDRAARAAYALQRLDDADARPAGFAREAEGWFERVIAFRDEAVAAGRARIAELATELAALREQLDAKEARAHELAAEVVALDGHAQELAARLRTYQDAERVWNQQREQLKQQVAELERERAEREREGLFGRLRRAFRRRG